MSVYDRFINDIKQEQEDRSYAQYETFKERYNYDIDSKTIEVNGNKVPYSFIIGGKPLTEAAAQNKAKPHQKKKGNEKQYIIIPYTSADKIKYVMDKSNIHDIYGESTGSQKKFSDKYDDFIVYYDKKGLVDSVEFWGGNVKVAGILVFKSKFVDVKQAIKAKDPAASVTKSSITSKKLGVIIKSNGLRCRSIMAVRKDYFDPED